MVEYNRLDYTSSNKTYQIQCKWARVRIGIWEPTDVCNVMGWVSGVLDGGQMKRKRQSSREGKSIVGYGFSWSSAHS